MPGFTRKGFKFDMSGDGQYRCTVQVRVRLSSGTLENIQERCRALDGDDSRRGVADFLQEAVSIGLTDLLDPQHGEEADDDF